MSKNKYFHALDIKGEDCEGRLRCTKACPTNAIRSYNKEVTFYDELCIDCGNCIQVCPEKVFRPVMDEIADFDSFEYLIVIPTPVLYTQFGLDVNPNVVDQALKKVGFNEVVNLYDMSNEVGYAINHFIKNNKERVSPTIISYCPTVVRFVQVGYPNLVPHVAEFDVPREIIAREIKKTYTKKLKLKEEEIGVIYITPCPAKLVSIKQPAEKSKSYIDSAISIKDIYNLVLPTVLELQKAMDKSPDQDRSFKYSRGWVAMNLIQRALGAERCISVSGIDHFKRILDDIENSKLRNVDVIEAHACVEECLGGAFCVENPYLARHKSIIMSKESVDNISIDTEKVIKEYDQGHYSLEHKLTPRDKGIHGSGDIATSIKRMKQKARIFAKLPNNNCGLCGAPTCEAFAEDCANGLSDLTQCVFLGKNEL